MTQAFLDFTLVLTVHHVDKIDNDETAQVPEPELPGYFIGSFKVRFVGRILDIATLGCPG